MSVIVTDKGFATDDWAHGFQPWDNITDRAWQGPKDIAVDLPSSAMASQVAPFLGHIALIRIDFPSSADGRGFSIARQLRQLGYRGRLRANGHVLADQYAMARRCGFDEVEISDDLAKRQPQDQWLFRANWQSHDYQSRLRARTNSPTL
ncbi:MAG: DUF934 domain-containing protein [Pseudomonadota bacterium]